MNCCFQSGFRWILSHTVLRAASALTLFRRPDRTLSCTFQNVLISCNFPINDMRKIFSGFKSLKIWEWDFLQLGSAIKATWHRNPCWRSDRRQQTALAQLHEGTTVQKQPSVQPSRLTVSSFGQHVSCNRTDGRTKPNNNINRYALLWLLMSLSAMWSGTWLCICWRPSPNSRYLKFSLSWPLKYCLQRCDAP